ncbi:MAG: energy-coupling factor transporter transmembrane component T [Clostridia bacterium]
MKGIESYHPIILFFYFMCVIFITMFTMHPVLIVGSFLGAVVFCGVLEGYKKLLKSFTYTAPMIAIMALTNPLFSHKGATILFYLSDNPVTLEAVIYGVFVALMFGAIFYWFRCYNIVITTEKFVFLFGRVLPKLSLILALVLNFVPKFKQSFSEINDAQKALGFYSTTSYFAKIKSKFRVLSILITKSLENSIETADSMRARGYGLKGRSNYAMFRWTLRDTIAGFCLLSLSVLVFVLMFLGGSQFLYYPTLSKISLNGIAITLYCGLFALMFLSVLIEIKENVLWRYLRLKI